MNENDENVIRTLNDDQFPFQMGAMDGGGKKVPRFWPPKTKKPDWRT